MKFTDLFIRRPVLALVVNLLIIIAGLQAIRTLNVRQYPRSENATVTVTTVYIGASANLVRGFITSPLERAIAAADGIADVESKSARGLPPAAPFRPPGGAARRYPRRPHLRNAHLAETRPNGGVQRQPGAGAPG